ncbi:MAG: DUF1573 domain-containing protein [Pedobacter sp.]|nr:DUF1573 domain-containing protein [Pedobacter sp.]MDQ8051610.1 DUF1573 domain-containing protein [Pedobacter sp.]
MKKIVYVLAILTGFVAFQAQAQTKVPAAPAAQAADAPDFKFVEETHDFGKIPQGKPVSVELFFTNTGKLPLIISAVEPTCGCTVAKYTQTPVKKGEKGSITLTYNAAAPGAFNKGITVKSNAKTPVKIIYIKGEVATAPATTTTSK